jgi:predicted DNA-binding transcriptional regulator AlpA
LTSGKKYGNLQKVTDPWHLNSEAFMEITVKFLTVKDVSELLKLSRSTIYEAFPVGRFPKPEKFGKASRWRVDNLEEFIELCKVMLAKPKPPRKDKGKA